ncbi:MAG: iron-sulfur cluster assembly scaffold protein, partial [bacterium]|nr:iron-sulfur cluster assembly scaffold protein [bacterium]
EDAYKIIPGDITKSLGGLPDNKIHCSVLGDKALRESIDNYYSRNGMANKVKNKEAKVVCKCLHITDADLKEAIKEGASTYYELQEKTKCGTVCGECEEEIKHILAEEIHH